LTRLTVIIVVVVVGGGGLALLGSTLDLAAAAVGRARRVAAGRRLIAVGEGLLAGM